MPSRNDKRHFLREFATLVRDNKQILFGKFTAKLTHKNKLDKWEEIRVQMVNKGFTALANRSSDYCRDITWQNIRRGTMDKRPPTGDSPRDDWDEVKHLKRLNKNEKFSFSSMILSTKFWEMM